MTRARVYAHSKQEVTKDDSLVRLSRPCVFLAKDILWIQWKLNLGNSVPIDAQSLRFSGNSRWMLEDPGWQRAEGARAEAVEDSLASATLVESPLTVLTCHDRSASTEKMRKGFQERGIFSLPLHFDRLRRWTIWYFFLVFLVCR